MANFEESLEQALVSSIGSLPFINGNPWLVSLSIFVLFALLSKVFAIIIDRIVLKISRRTKTNIDDRIVSLIDKPLGWFIFVLGIKLALVPIPVFEGFISVLQRILNSVIILILALMVKRTVEVFIDEWGRKYAERSKSSLDDELIPLLKKFMNIFLFIIAMLLILSTWGVPIGPFLASLGIAGLAIGLALQDTLSNVFAGVSLILDKNFKSGDVVKLDSGESGRVQDVGLRSTKIVNWDHEVIILPNSALANAKIINYAQPELKSRLQLNFGVEYGSNVSEVRRVVMGVIKKHPDVLDDPEPSVRFRDMADFSLNFTAYIWTSTYKNRFPMKDDLTEGVYNALNRAGIGIPFPTRTLYLKQAAQKRSRNVQRKTAKKAESGSTKAKKRVRSKKAVKKSQKKGAKRAKKRAKARRK